MGAVRIIFEGPNELQGKIAEPNLYDENVSRLEREGVVSIDALEVGSETWALTTLRHRSSVGLRDMRAAAWDYIDKVTGSDQLNPDLKEARIGRFSNGMLHAERRAVLGWMPISGSEVQVAELLASEWVPPTYTSDI
jgi:hypothetical protein